MNLLDQSVIKKGKKSAQRKAAPDQAPLLPSGLPSVGSPRVRPPAGLLPARREGFAAFPGETKTKAAGPGGPARPPAPGPLLSLGRYRGRGSFPVPKGPDGRTLLLGSPGAHPAGDLRGKPGDAPAALGSSSRCSRSLRPPIGAPCPAAGQAAWAANRSTPRRIGPVRRDWYRGGGRV